MPPLILILRLSLTFRRAADNARRRGPRMRRPDDDDYDDDRRVGQIRFVPPSPSSSLPSSVFCMDVFFFCCDTADVAVFLS